MTPIVCCTYSIDDVDMDAGDMRNTFTGVSKIDVVIHSEEDSQRRLDAINNLVKWGEQF